MSARPTCPVCGKPIPKLTTTVCVEKGERLAHHKDSRWQRFVFPDPLPRTKDDCRRLSNQEVVSVTYHTDYNYESDTHARGPVWRFFEWDGQTYWTASYPFCKPDCAVAFARAAYRAGYRLQGAK